MSSVRNFTFFAIFCQVVACGGSPGHDESVDDEALGEAERAATASWFSPTCDQDGLDSPSGTGGSCDGPYLYSKDPDCTEAHPDCGPEMIRSCAHWANSIAYMLPYVTYAMRSVNCNQTCTGMKCFSSCEKFYPQSPATWCGNEAFNLEGSIEALPDPAHLSLQDLVWMQQLVSVTPGNTSQYTSAPEVVLKTPTKTVTRWTITQSCPMTVSNYPVAATAPNKTYCGSDGYPVCDHCPRVDGLVSAPGTAYAGLGPDVVAAECLTCDHEPTAGKAQCLLGKLDGAVPAGVDPGTYHAALVARLKLLFELHADLLSDAERARVLALYASDAAAPVCAAPLPDEPACSGAVNGLLEACHALTLPHVSGALLLGQIDACLAAFDVVAAEADPACRTSAVDTAADVLELLVDKAFTAQVTPGPNGVPGGLAAALDLVDRWYDHAAPAAPDDAWLRRRTSAIVDLFWRHAYHAPATPLPTATTANVDALLADLSGTGRAVDYAVLDAAYSGASTIDSPPILLITGDALAATVEKLRFISIAHDLACQYQTCSPAAGDDVIIQLWSVLAALEDPTKLSQALAAAPALQQRHPTLRAALLQLQAQHARLSGARTAQPEWALAIDTIVDDAAARSALAQATGSTTGRHGRVLHAGVQQEAEIRNLLTQRETALNHALEEYQDSKVVLVNAVLQQMQGTQQEEAIRHEQEQIGAELILLVADMMGVRAREAAEEARFADVAGVFKHLIDVGVFDADVAASSDVQPPLVVSGQSSVYSGASGQTPQQLAVRTISLDPGQQLRFVVSGEWSPSCALQRANLPGPAGMTYPVGNKDALVGPEGYRLQWSGTDYRVESSSQSSSYSFNASAKACIEASSGLQFLGNGGKATIQVCAGGSYDSSDADSTQNGADTRTAASFSGGLRLAETPFRDAPAGALLIVATTPGTAVVRDVQVMQRQGVYVAPYAVDVHVIVNDIHKSSCNVRADALSVDMIKVTSLGALGAPLAAAMAATLGEIEEQAPEILAQGALLGGEATALRSMAWTTLAEHVGMNLDSLPPGVSGFFGAWLDKELASLERRAYIASLKRQIDVQLRRLEQLDQDLLAAVEQSRLLALIPRWRARNLAAQEIAPELAALLDTLEHYAPPVFELRYPDEHAALLTAGATQLNGLRTLSLDGDAEDVVTAVLALSQQVRWRLETASVDLSTEGLTQVALLFPRPAATAFNCADFGTCFTSLWGRAAQLVDPWAGLPADGMVTLHVKPEDLYTAHGGVARLDCNDHAPVIHRMGLYLVFSDDIDLTPYNLRLPVFVGRRQEFPTAGGVIAYHTARQTNSLSVRVSSGLDQNALTRLPATETVGQGLSPFGDFTVDMTNLPAEHLGNASALVLVLELERHRPGPEVALPGICQPLP